MTDHHTPKSLSDRDVVVRRADVVAESFGPVDVVFDPATTLVRRLNATASAIWRGAATPRTVADIVAEVSAAGPGESSTAHDDVVQFCAELLAWGLLETADEEGCT